MDTVAHEPKNIEMTYIIMIIVLLHIAVGFAYFIWKLEFQGKKKEKSKESLNRDDVDKQINSN